MFKLSISCLFLTLAQITLSTACPDNWTQAVLPCTCSSSFKRRSAAGHQTQYAVACTNVDVETVQRVFANISAATDLDNVVEHFGVIGLRSVDNYIMNDFFRGLVIKSVAITRSGLRTFGAKAFRGVTDSLDLSYNELK